MRRYRRPWKREGEGVDVWGLGWSPRGRGKRGGRRGEGQVVDLRWRVRGSGVGGCRSPRSMDCSVDQPRSVPCQFAQTQPLCVGGGICDCQPNIAFGALRFPSAVSSPLGHCNSGSTISGSAPACQNPGEVLADLRTRVQGSGGSGMVLEEEM